MPDSAIEEAVVIDGLGMTYGPKVAVDGLCLTISRGVVAAVLGRNGAGKTTTLETCEGYRRPHRGSVRVLGLDPIGDHDRLMPRIGVMLQDGGAWGGARAIEMLTHFSRLYRNPLPVDMLVERLGLAECGRTAYRRLSGGQRQRLSLAMALIGRPELVFIDEPTAGMDVATRHETWGLIDELRSDGVTVVLTTHYLEEAEQLADVVHIIDKGRLIASGTPDELTSGESATIRLEAGTDLPELPEYAGVAAVLVDAHTAVFTGQVDVSTLSRLTQWCLANHVVPQHLEFGRRDLEAVFLDLTAEGSR